MKRIYVEAIVVSFLLVSCAGGPARAQSGGPVFVVTTKNQDDQINVQHQNGTSIIEVESPSGIGSATFELESGNMPEQVILRLHLRGLEELRLTSVQTSIAASVSNSDPSEIHQRIAAASIDTPILPGEPLWMEIEIVSERAVEMLPLEEGYFEVRVPGEFLRKAGISFEVKWIDFHR
jgi:hypothetical protein